MYKMLRTFRNKYVFFLNIYSLVLTAPGAGRFPGLPKRTVKGFCSKLSANQEHRWAPLQGKSNWGGVGQRAVTYCSLNLT